MAAQTTLTIILWPLLQGKNGYREVIPVQGSGIGVTTCTAADLAA